MKFLQTPHSQKVKPNVEGKKTEYVLSTGGAGPVNPKTKNKTKAFPSLHTHSIAELRGKNSNRFDNMRHRNAIQFLVDVALLYNIAYICQITAFAVAGSSFHYIISVGEMKIV